MNYITRKTIYYTVLIAEILNLEYENVFEKVASVFRQQDNAALKELTSDTALKRFKSTASINMQIAFVQSFADENEYGANDSQMSALEIKRNALQFLENLSQDSTSPDLLNTLLRLQREKGCCTALVALLLYVQGRYNNKSTAALGKALKNGDLDAGLILLFFSDKSRYGPLCTEVCKCEEYLIYPEITDILADNYGLEKETGDGI